jgi:hypothetical protein
MFAASFSEMVFGVYHFQILKLLGEDLKPVDSHLSSFTRDAKIENNYRILNKSKRTFKSLNVIYNKLCFYLRLCSSMWAYMKAIFGENRMSNQEWTIQRHGQNGYKTQNEEKQKKKKTQKQKTKKDEQTDVKKTPTHFKIVRRRP